MLRRFKELLLLPITTLFSCFTLLHFRRQSVLILHLEVPPALVRLVRDIFMWRAGAKTKINNAGGDYRSASSSSVPERCWFNDAPVCFVIISLVRSQFPKESVSLTWCGRTRGWSGLVPACAPDSIENDRKPRNPISPPIVCESGSRKPPPGCGRLHSLARRARAHSGS